MDFGLGLGGQLGEIGANIEDYVYNNLRKVNSKHAKDILMVEAPPIDLFDAILKKIFTMEVNERAMVNMSEDKNELVQEARRS